MLGAVALVVATALGGTPPVAAEVYYAKDEALGFAFPEAEVVSRTRILTDADVGAIAQRTGKPPPSKLVAYHEARRDGAVVGYGIIDTHVVRTLPEAVLVVLTPVGAVERVLLLAFHEPPEYAPSERWLRQFHGRDASTAAWRVGRDLHGITGATLTAHAVTATVRRAVALFDVVIRPSGGP